MQYPIKVSVIIPVYNTKKYLRECLDSVVNQTLKDIEIILIDDGSTDGSAEICKSYLSDSRVSYYYKKMKALPLPAGTVLSAQTENISDLLIPMTGLSLICVK